MVSLPAATWPLASTSSPPSISVTKPPASRTSSMPAARSHGDRSRSQKASKRPAATQARSSVAAPIAAQAREVVLRGGDFVASERKVAAAVMRQPASHDRLGKPLPRGDADTPVVEESALAAFGDKQLLVRRIVGQRGNDRVVSFERDGDGEMRDAVQEVGGAVERIDDPAMRLVGAGAGAAFLAEEAVIGPRLGKLLVHDLFGAAIGGGDEIARALERDLKVFDLAEIALEAAAGAARRLEHDIEDCGVEHGACGTVQLAPASSLEAWHPSPRRALDRVEIRLRGLSRRRRGSGRRDWPRNRRA